MAESGTRVSALVLSAEPVEAAPRPELARALLAWLRAVSVETDSAEAPEAFPPAVTVPATALVDCVPLTVPPAVLTQMFFNVSGLCQNCGATSITTWYWFNAP